MSDDPILAAIASLRTDFLSELGKTRAELMERIERIEGDIGTMRDDATVLQAIVLRMDGTVSALLREIRATHAQQSRLANRVAALEKAP